MVDSRQLAVDWLDQVVNQGVSVNQLLLESGTPLAAEQLSFTKQLLFGCLRYYHQLNTIANNLLNKPFKAKDRDLQIVILVGLYQLKYLSTPDHAAISESVELTRKLKKDWATGLVNGVLRRYQRESEKIEAALAKSIQFQFSHPGWLVKRLRQDWPDEAETILTQNNQRAPMTLRVNSSRQNRADYITTLAQESIEAQPHLIAPDAVQLASPIDVYQLPGFESGLVTVQDAAAQLAVEMLDLQPGLKVLDGCAAPGGKTTHILQRGEAIRLTAVEMSAKRAQRIEDTLGRMQMQCTVKVADICDHSAWWDGELFDRILLDVPCSATGVIRRNPDIKVHRLSTDIQPLVALQKQILAQSWSLLKPGGILIYATCSVLKAENEQQMKTFLSHHSAELLTMPSVIHQALTPRAAVGYQIFPGENQMDGFYLCGLRKPA